jgi:general stress protein 26
MGAHVIETPKSHAEHLAKLLTILRSTDTVVLLTRTADRIAGRPMALVDVDDDGTVYLTTAIGSQKAVEIAADSAVNVTAQTSKGIVSIEGNARLTQERAVIDRLWKDSWRIWYPEGRSSPSIAIVIVSPVEGSYWDTSVAHGLSFLWRAVKARIAGADVEINASDVGSVQMHH